MLKEVQIRNFKSIKALDIAPKRVNVIIGKPNVGKSNILEALSLFCAGYMRKDMLKPYIRMDSLQELFYRKNIKNKIFVKTDLGSLDLSYHFSDSYLLRIDPQNEISEEPIDSLLSINEIEKQFYSGYNFNNAQQLKLKPLFLILNNSINESDIIRQLDLTFYSPIKRYIFNSFPYKPTPLHYPHSLSVPFGENIVTILYNEPDLLQFFAELFKNEYNLDLVLKSPENTLELQLRDGMITNSISMNLIADTLQRFIFYLTVIESNKGSVLLLEEPEAHSFPPYTDMLASKIAKDSSNQYFITTHSPYLLNTLIDETPKGDIGIFITKYEKHQTSLYKLSAAEVVRALDNGIDLFYNYDKYTG